MPTTPRLNWPYPAETRSRMLAMYESGASLAEVSKACNPKVNSDRDHWEAHFRGLLREAS